MRILITGVTGFVGRNLLPLIEKRLPDSEVLTLNRSVEKARTMFPDKKWRHCLLDDAQAVIDFSPEVVLHLAALTTSVRNDSEIIAPMLDANIVFGVRLLDTLGKCGDFKLFVNTGSFAEYRFGTGSIDDAYLYTATKSAFRIFVKYYSELHRFRFINVVPFSVYGGIPTVKRLMDYIIESLGSEKPVDMTAGEQILDFVHVDDLADFYVTVLENTDKISAFQNGIDFYIGTGRGVTVHELAAVVEKVYGQKCNINWGGRPYRDRDTMHAVAPIARNLSLLNWRAKINLEDGIRMMKESLRNKRR